jgi:formate dehydrogenase subunit gamma
MSEYVVRFSLRQRAEHFLVMVIFIALAVTGFPQKFFDASWAGVATDALGGLARMRWLHRAAGILFAVLTLVHVVSAIAGAASGKMRLSMVPSRKDFIDAITMLRYYLRLADVPARFDRFDYREKFEYWGLIIGAFVMVSTGFILLYPIPLTRLLPGELIPVAKVAHSNEGLMAFLVVITWHIYNAHFAPDIFPFNKSIFTGRISKEHLRKDHPLEYARLFPGEASEAPPADTNA